MLIRLALGEGEEALAMLERASAAPGSAPLVVGSSNLHAEVLVARASSIQVKPEP